MLLNPAAPDLHPVESKETIRLIRKIAGIAKNNQGRINLGKNYQVVLSRDALSVKKNGEYVFFIDDALKEKPVAWHNLIDLDSKLNKVLTTLQSQQVLH